MLDAIKCEKKKMEEEMGMTRWAGMQGDWGLDEAIVE